MDKKIKDMLKVYLVLLCIIGLIFCFTISHEHYHLEKCKIEYCSVCAVIHTAETIMQIVITCITYLAIKIMISYILSKIKIEDKVIFSNSLICQKVQLNE